MEQQEAVEREGTDQEMAGQQEFRPGLCEWQRAWHERLIRRSLQGAEANYMRLFRRI